MNSSSLNARKTNPALLAQTATQTTKNCEFLKNDAEDRLSLIVYKDIINKQQINGS